MTPEYLRTSARLDQIGEAARRNELHELPPSEIDPAVIEHVVSKMPDGVKDSSRRLLESILGKDNKP